MKRLTTAALTASLLATGLSCTSDEPSGLAKSRAAATTVKFDWYAKPLPEIPLPNDIATRYDETSATGRRVNASMLAPTRLESRVRELIDELDGWGVLQPITIPFTAELDVQSILDGHRDPDYALENDVIYLINVDPDSDEFGEFHHIDLGNGNYPPILKDLGGYWKNDPRDWTLSLLFDEENEDKNGNGKLDPGEDTNADGFLAVPNYLPGKSPARDDLAARADALMTFYERRTNTIIAKPMTPLLERTTYAVVVTKRLRDANGEPVGSPFEFVNHASQTAALAPLGDLLPKNGLSKADIAFAFTFTTQTMASAWMAVRDGLYGHGVQAHLGEQFPAEIGELLPLVASKDSGPPIDNPYIVYTEELFTVLPLLAAGILGQDPSSAAYQAVENAHRYIDYHVMGSFESPQLFSRTDENGELLPLNEQSWPQDLHRVVAPARGEKVYFWMTVPRKEVSARKDGKPGPVILLSHGYTGNRTDVFMLGGHFARHGMATISIECVSHGLDFSDDETQLAKSLLDSVGLSSIIDALGSSRAFDQNRDGRKDSGADFWTSYLFHTRDVVRQSALDHMQLIRIIRGFDGSRRWAFDVNGDGEKDLAGDFDGDGQVDVGTESSIGMTGGSLGGMMSALLAAIEPELAVAVPIAGGGGMTDIGVRSLQGGVREAVILRVMGPLWVGTLDAATGKMLVETVVPDLNDDALRAVANVTGVEPGDTLVAWNRVTGEQKCGYVTPEGKVRAAVAADKGDRVDLIFYEGDAVVTGSDCVIAEGAKVRRAITTFEEFVSFQGRSWSQGEPLVALADGLGLARVSPSLRRFLGIGQMVLDPTDPAANAPHMVEKPIVYDGTKTQTGTHTLVVTTIGDMNVPANTGVTIGRSAGFVPYTEVDPRYGKPANQVLIDNYMTEAVNLIGRFKNVRGEPVLMDVEDFSDDGDLWRDDQIPRLSTPLRLVKDDKLCELGPEECGKSGAIFPYPRPEGQHGFAFPGDFTDRERERCKVECTTEGAPFPCDACGSLEPKDVSFDIGYFMFNMLGRYAATGGKEVSFDHCNSRNDCDYLPESPAAREITELRK
jgi:hypothetical protein